MPTAAEKVNIDVEAALQRSQAVVQIVAGELTRTAADASQRARMVSEAVTQVQNDVRDLLRADMLPMEFTGVIHDYRFGMFGNEVEKLKGKGGGKGVNVKKAKPTHRFEVEIPGAGLWLHVRCSSSDFEEFLMASEGLSAEDGTLDPNALNGMTVTVKRDKANNRLVPIGLGTITQEAVPLGEDKSGKPLFKGDMVRVREYRYQKAYGATVLDYRDGAWTFQRRDRVKPTRLAVGRIQAALLFEKIDK